MSAPRPFRCSICRSTWPSCSGWIATPRLAFVLPVVQVAWVNTQGLFVLGPIVLGFALIDAALRPGSFAKARRPWWRKVGLATFLTGVACLINPYGLSGALYPLELARTMSNPIFSTTIAELTPIPLFIQQVRLRRASRCSCTWSTMVLGALSFLVPLCWIVWVRLTPASPAGAGRQSRRPRAGQSGGSRRPTSDKAQAAGRRARAERARGAWRLSPFRLLLFVAFSALSWQATRNSHQFAAVVGTVTAWNFGEWAAAIRKRRAPRIRGGTQAASRSPLIVLVVRGGRQRDLLRDDRRGEGGRAGRGAALVSARGRRVRRDAGDAHALPGIPHRARLACTSIDTARNARSSPTPGSRSSAPTSSSTTRS